MSTDSPPQGHAALSAAAEYQEQVLLVDDNPTNLQLLYQTLEGHDYKLLVARSGEAALKIARKSRPALILLDIMMPPGIDGYETCRRLKADPTTREVAVIFLSARDELKDRIRGFGLGAVDYIPKPFQAEEVIARVNTHLAIHRLQRQLARSNEVLKQLNEDLERRVEERSAEVLRSRDAVIFGMAKLAESRDDVTGMHLERICKYSEALARALARKHPEIDERWVHAVATTAALHDIGKVATPDAVLLKEGPLTEEEQEIIRRHPCIGGDMLLDIKNRWGENTFLVTAAQIALCHHEKWDGSGYPYGLSGDNIPLSARIVAVADVYDTLTSKRSYKDRVTHEEALRIIENGAGSHFDPQVVKAFLTVGDEFQALAQQMHGYPGGVA
ncbi:MAG: response regulator [Phycisphaerales bacterium]|nr:MAG: response regulator [Phycisphaerales bacterium]